MTGGIFDGTCSNFCWKLDAQDAYPYSNVQFENNNGLDNLNNSDYPSVLYSISCDVIPFDITSSIGNNGAMNSGESYTTNSSAGGVAFLGNTRYGWVGSSYLLYKNFAQHITSGGSNTHLGISESISKSSFSDHYLSYTHNLIGCPETEIWTAAPRQFTVNYNPNVILVNTSNNIVVNVDNLEYLKEAVICLYKENNEIFSVITVIGDINQHASFTFNNIIAPTIGNLYLTVTSHNYIPYQTTIPVIGDCNYSGAANNITYNQTWSDVHYSNSDININPNVTLTIKNTLLIHSSAKILVQVGGKLIINGGKISNACGGLWQGIQVQGNPALSQNPATNQGVVELKNGATIENAIIGIYAPAHKYAIDQVTTGFGGGGIIKATDAIFRNCIIGAKIESYHNFNPNTNASLPNRSYFKKCTFETTNSFNTGSLPQTFIYLDKVEGINILGNTFQNTNTSMASNDRGKGIESYDANFSVKPFCSSLWVPCPPTSQIPNNFTNLVYGINSSNINTTKSVFIDNNVFNNNAWDIVLNSIEGAKVTKNDINRGGGFSSGIYLNYCNGYKVEENTIDNGLAGIVINYSGINANEIYNNTFTHNLRSCQAQGTNGDNLLQTGLQFKCNEFHNLNSYAIDINVTSGGIKPVQGYCLNDNTPAGNCFTFPTLCSKQLSKSPSASPFTYNSHSGVGCTLPSSVSSGIIVHQCTGITYNPATSCPSKINQIINPTAKIAAINTNTQAINTLSAQIDGGSTQNLLNKVSSNISSGALKDFLLAGSPYLTDTVLIAALNRSQPMTPGHIKDVMVPNSPLTTKVMNVLITKTLPPGIRKQIITAQTGTSARTILMQQIAQLNTDISTAENQLLQYYLSDTTGTGIDSLRMYLQANANPINKERLVEVYFTQNNYSAAITTLNTIQQKTSADSNFVKFYNLLADVFMAGRSMFELDSIEKQKVINVSTSKTPVAKNAQALLHKVYGDTFNLIIEDLILPDSLSIRGYLTEGNECNSLSVSNDTLVLLDQNNALVTGVTPVVSDQNGYFHFDAMQLMMLDTTAKYTISPQNSFLIDSTYYKTIKEWISAGDMVLHVLKVDKVWEQTFNSPDSLNATGQDIDLNGNIYVLGTAYNLQTGGNNITLLKYDSLGTLKWSVLHSTGQGTDNIATGLYVKNNSIYILGTSWLQSGKFNHNIVLAKYNTNGALQWQSIYDNNGFNDDASKITGDNAGNIYVSGWSASGTGLRSAILIKTDSIGTRNWVYQNTHSCSQLMNYPISVLNNDLTGNLYITFDSDTSQHTSSFVKLNTSGTLVWETLIPDLLVRAMIQDSTGNIYLSGNSATASYSSYIKKYATSGTIIWDRKFDGNVYAGSDNLQINHAGKLIEAGNDKFGFTLRTIDKQNGNVLNYMAYKGDWFHQYTFADIALDKFDNIYLTNTINDLKAVQITNLIHTFKFSNTLQKVWELWDKSIASDIVVSKNGNIYLTGTKSTANNTTMKNDIVTYKYSQCTANANLLRTVNNQDNNNKSNQYVLLYPNPNDGNMTVEYNIPETETGVFEIYDISGKKILSRPLAGGKNSFAISETQLTRGIYFYRASIGKKQIGFDKVIVIK